MAKHLPFIISAILIQLVFAIDRGIGVLYLKASQQQVFDTVSLNDESIETRIRITWGGGVAKRWQGTIDIRNATFSNPSALGVNPDSASQFFVSPDRKQIRIRHVNESAFEGVDVSVTGTSNATIEVDLTDQSSRASIQQGFSIESIAKGDQIFALDSSSNRFSIANAPGNRILFRTSRPHLIFEANETFEFALKANLFFANDLRSQCLMEIVAARSNAPPLNSYTVNLQSNGAESDGYIQQKFQVPSLEGVYELRLFLGGKQGSIQRRNLPDRAIQFVVLDRNKERMIPDAFSTKVAEFGPETLRSSMSQQFTRMIGFRNQQAFGRFAVSNDEQSVNLPIGGWQAIPFSVSQIDKPHVVEIDYNPEGPMSLGFSILQPDSSGQVPSLGFDSGLSVPNSIVESEASGPKTHRFVFWPRSRSIHLLVANRDNKRPATYSGVRVYQAKNSTSRGLRETQANEKTRSAMAFVEQPLLIENFGVDNFDDAGLGQPINDWVSFYQSVNRLARFLVESGHSGAFVNVYGEGSSLMPLESVQVSPRYDSGIFSSIGSDPLRKDVVELCYRIFERNGLKFVPVLSFDSRIAEIESDTSAQASLWDYQGNVVQGEESPVYNPLNEKVQDKVVEIVTEISARYSQRPSFSGLAVVCRPDVFTMLPGIRLGGYDLPTLQRFDQQLENRQSLLTVDRYSSWLAWRMNQMTLFYQKLAKSVVGTAEGAKLYLPLIEIFSGDEIQAQLSPSLHRTIDLPDSLKRLGLDLKVLNQDDSLVVLQPNVVAPLHELSTRKSEVAARSSQQWSHWNVANSYPGTIFVNRSSWARFENLESTSLFDRQESPIYRLQHLNPAGEWNQERFAKSLLEGDSRILIDGGVLLNTNLDKGMIRFREIYTQLPDRPFVEIFHESHPDDRHPAIARYLKQGESVYLYCVNGSPWNVNLQVQSNLNSQNQLQVLSGRQSSQTIRVNDDGRISISLKPFELFAFKCEANDAGFTSFDYKLPESAARDLSKSFYELKSKLIASGSAKPLKVLEQPSFENGSLSPSWQIGNQDVGQFTLSRNNALHGAYAMNMNNKTDGVIWIRSNRFPVPETGRLTVSAWLKSDGSSSQPPLRISLENAESGSSYYRFAKVGSLTQDKKNNQLSTEWRRFVVHFEDLPVNSNNGLRLGFDLMGKGSVWVDQVEVFDRWMDEIDLKALTQLISSIGPLIDKPEKMERCRQIMNGYWPQFLREYFEATTGTVTANSDDQDLGNQPKLRSTMRRRFRRFVSPGIFQFR